MKIGIIGAGNVGAALGTGWTRRGHEVVFGVRDPASPRAARLLSELGGKARVGSAAEAASFGGVVALATPWSSTHQAIQSAGDLRGKALFDCTNPIGLDGGLAVGYSTSAGEQVAGWATGARVVKVFNTTGAANMANSRYGDQAPTMFYCGDDAAAKALASKLAADLGFEPVDAGPLTRARLLEPLAALWIALAYPQGLSRDIAFKLLRR